MRKLTHIDNEILVLRSQQGDAQAFECLFQAWHERLWRHGRRLTGSDEAASDVSQEAWLAMVRGLGRLARPELFPAWAFRIVTNKCNDLFRKRSRRKRLHDDYGEEMQRTRTEDTQREGHDLLSLVSNEDRALLSLHYVEGFKIAEIAEILGIAPGTVKSRLYHARNRLRARLEDEENG